MYSGLVLGAVYDRDYKHILQSFFKNTSLEQHAYEIINFTGGNAMCM